CELLLLAERGEAAPSSNSNDAARGLSGKHPVDAGSAQAEPLGDLRGSQAHSLEAHHIHLLRPRSGFASLVLTKRPRLGNPFALSLQHDLALELSYACQYREHEAARRRACVNPEVENP